MTFKHLDLEQLQYRPHHSPMRMRLENLVHSETTVCNFMCVTHQGKKIIIITHFDENDTRCSQRSLLQVKIVKGLILSKPHLRTCILFIKALNTEWGSELLILPRRCHDFFRQKHHLNYTHSRNRHRVTHVWLRRLRLTPNIMWIMPRITDIFILKELRKVSLLVAMFQICHNPRKQKGITKRSQIENYSPILRNGLFLIMENSKHILQ